MPANLGFFNRHYLEDYAQNIRNPTKGQLAPNIDIDDANTLIGEVQKAQVIRPFINNYYVAQKAVEKLSSTNIDEAKEPEQDVSPNWLNYFGECAENVNTEELRDLWTNILAGEIRKFGAFSLMTGVVLIWCGSNLPHSQQKQIAAAKKAG